MFYITQLKINVIQNSLLSLHYKLLYIFLLLLFCCAYFKYNSKLQKLFIKAFFAILYKLTIKSKTIYIFKESCPQC